MRSMGENVKVILELRLATFLAATEQEKKSTMDGMACTYDNSCSTMSPTVHAYFTIPTF